MRLTSLLAPTLFGAFLLTSPCFAQQQPPGAMPQQNPKTAPNSQQPNDPGMSAPAPAKADDKKFMKEAALGGLAEVELGQLAVTKGSSDAVKTFGQKLVDDHTKANAQLKDAATKAGFPIPESIDSKHQARINKLAKLNGAEFDKAFVKDQVKDHEADVRSFQEESQNGSNAEVKAFAGSALPVLQEHLSMAKGLLKSSSTD